MDELSGKVVGYVLAKMEDEGASADSKKIAHGHITSISVLRDYRKLGLATKLMRAAHHQMKTVYEAKYCSLHVRVTNRAAMALYRDVLGYEVCTTAEEYYADKEDAYDMKMFFDPAVRPQILKSSALGAASKFGEEEKTGEDALGGNEMAADSSNSNCTNT